MEPNKMSFFYQIPLKLIKKNNKLQEMTLWWNASILFEMSVSLKMLTSYCFPPSLSRSHNTHTHTLPINYSLL